MDDPTAAVRGVYRSCRRRPTYRFELITGLAMSYLEELMRRYGPTGARERLSLALWDVEVDGDV